MLDPAGERLSSAGAMATAMCRPVAAQWCFFLRARIDSFESSIETRMRSRKIDRNVRVVVFSCLDCGR